MIAFWPIGCLLCGASPIQLHHPTRRPTPGRPNFDEDLRIALCCRPPRNCHARVHQALRTLGLDFLPKGYGPLSYRVLCLKVHLRICIDADVPFVLADQKAECALDALLLEVAQELAKQETPA